MRAGLPVLSCLCGAILAAQAQPMPQSPPLQALAPLAGSGPLPPSPWRVAGLPDQVLPLTQFAVVDLAGRRVLRVQSAGSYGNLVHAAQGPAGTLSWTWRVDQPVTGADLRQKRGDDTALKVCALFDQPLQVLPFWERQKLRMARGLSGEHLPSATLCYVWDPTLPPGSVLPNVYTDRVRWIGLDGVQGQWQSASRDLRADFLKAFADDGGVVPALSAIAVGADADNTGGGGLAYITDLALRP